MTPFQRRRNGRPDTPEEMLADQMAQGMGGGAQQGANLFNQPQVFPGDNFGTQDINRAGTFLADRYFQMIAPLLQQNQGLFNQGQGIFNQNNSTFQQNNDLFNQFGQLGQTADLNNLISKTAGINNQVLSGQLPQAVDQLIQPYLNTGISKINAQLPTAWRQAEDQLPRALAAQSKLDTLDSSVRGAADLSSSLFNTLAPQLVSGAMNAGNPQNLANLFSAQGNLLGQQSGISGQQSGILGQLGNLVNQQSGLLGQQAGLPFQIIQGLGSLDNQQKALELARKQSKGK